MSTWVHQSKSMRARGSKSGVKNKTPKLPETKESLGKIRIFFLLNSNFPHTKFDFLQWLSAFFNGFLISSMAFWFSSTAFRSPRNPRKSTYGSKTAFCFFQQLSHFFNGFPIFLIGFPIFLNGFPLSEKSKKIYLRRQVYERSLFELRISCHPLPELRNSR